MDNTDIRGEFLKLYDTYYKAVYFTSLGVVHQPDAAEDCMQETFLALWQGLQKGTEYRNVGGWLLQVARNQGISRLRRQCSLSSLEDMEDLLSTPGDATSRETEEAAFISHILAGLPQAERDIFVLHVQGGLKLAEIAKSLEIPAATIRWRFANARKLLKAALKTEEQREKGLICEKG
jgi:RNA polymerase sigma factor (sigma-70 family)